MVKFDPMTMAVGTLVMYMGNDSQPTTLDIAWLVCVKSSHGSVSPRCVCVCM